MRKKTKVLSIVFIQQEAAGKRKVIFNMTAKELMQYERLVNHGINPLLKIEKKNGGFFELRASVTEK